MRFEDANAMLKPTNPSANLFWKGTACMVRSAQNVFCSLEVDGV